MFKIFKYLIVNDLIFRIFNGEFFFISYFDVSLWGIFFLCFSRNVYQSALFPQTLLLCPEIFLVAHLHFGIILFSKRSILNVWKCSEYISVSITAHQFEQWPYAMYCIRHILAYSTFCISRYMSTYSIIFTHIDKLLGHFQAFTGIFSALCNHAYSQPCHVLSPGLFRTGSLFKTL